MENGGRKDNKMTWKIFARVFNMTQQQRQERQAAGANSSPGNDAASRRNRADISHASSKEGRTISDEGASVNGRGGGIWIGGGI